MRVARSASCKRSSTMTKPACVRAIDTDITQFALVHLAHNAAVIRRLATCCDQKVEPFGDASQGLRGVMQPDTRLEQRRCRIMLREVSRHRLLRSVKPAASSALSSAPA